mgnify:CR=1 FL=1|tara:strand:+ start:239 stop:553 length:315 start_codon:yes stop_codon:yes gene_type:complete
MSFWLFKPTSLLSSNNVLVYNISSFEEFMNFLTVLMVGLALIFKNKFNQEAWRKAFLISFLTICFLGILLHFASPPQNIAISRESEFINGIEIPKFSNSLTVDN